MTERAALYCRISQTADDVDKTEIQERRLREAAAQAGYEVAAVFTDDGISAFSGKLRPSYVELVAGIRADRFDVIMAVAPDRFARNVAENEALQLECVAHGVVWHTLSAGVSDPASPMSKAMASIAGVLAELESATKGERVRARFADKARLGLPKGGKRRFGYEPDQITPRESEAVYIREAYETMLTGGSIWGITKHWNESGVVTTTGKPWTTASVRDVLKRPSNAGVLMVNGVRQPVSRIEPLVDEVKHDELVALIEARAVRRGPKRQHLLSGIMRCSACGAPMNVNTREEGRRLYVCKSKASPGTVGRHVTVAADIADEAIPWELFTVMLNQGDRGRDVAAQRVTEARGELADLTRQREGLQELWIVPGSDKTFLTKQLGTLADRITRLEAEVQDALTASATATLQDALVQALGGRALTEPGGMTDLQAAYRVFEEAWKQLPLERQRETIKALVSVTLLPSRFTGKTDPERLEVEPLSPIMYTE